MWIEGYAELLRKNGQRVFFGGDGIQGLTKFCAETSLRSHSPSFVLTTHPEGDEHLWPCDESRLPAEIQQLGTNRSRAIVRRTYREERGESETKNERGLHTDFRILIFPLPFIFLVWVFTLISFVRLFFPYFLRNFFSFTSNLSGLNHRRKSQNTRATQWVKVRTFTCPGNCCFLLEIVRSFRCFICYCND